MSLTNIGTPFLVRTGMLSKLSAFLISELMVVRYMVLSSRKLPDGDITLNFDNASTTSSGVRLKLLSLFGSTLKMIERALEPKGGGAERPGIVANIGLM